MKKIHRRLVEGLGQFAAVEDADFAGYLDQEEAVAADRIRLNFGVLCEGLALEYLQAHAAPAQASQALRSDLRSLARETDIRSFTDDEAGLIDRFARKLDDDIERVSKMGGFQRGLIRWMVRTPSLVKVLIFLGIIVVTAIAIGKVVGR